MALHYARGEVDIGQPLVVESILGTRFTGRVVETTTCGEFAAVIPEVEGAAHITGYHTFVVDPDDPLRAGFLVR
jgi:trans-L-3-hydroxyproline dehydratase